MSKSSQMEPWEQMLRLYIHALTVNDEAIALHNALLNDRRMDPEKRDRMLTEVRSVMGDLASARRHIAEALEERS